MIETYYIFRHGLATHSKTGYGDDILTAEVLPEAIPQVKRLGVYLQDVKAGFHVRSELIRCQQTAEIVAEARGVTFSSDARLNEYHNETFDEMKARVKYFLDEINEQPHKQVMICSHGMIIAALTNFITKGDFIIANQNEYPDPGGLFIINGTTVEKILP